jgi:hypothetical protein
MGKSKKPQEIFYDTKIITDLKGFAIWSLRPDF